MLPVSSHSIPVKFVSPPSAHDTQAIKFPTRQKIASFLKQKYGENLSHYGFPHFSEPYTAGSASNTLAKVSPEQIQLVLKPTAHGPTPELEITLSGGEGPIVPILLSERQQLDPSGELPPDEVMPQEVFFLLQALATAQQVKRYAGAVIIGAEDILNLIEEIAQSPDDENPTSCDMAEVDMEALPLDLSTGAKRNHAALDDSIELSVPADHLDGDKRSRPDSVSFQTGAVDTPPLVMDLGEICETLQATPAAPATASAPPADPSKKFRKKLLYWLSKHINAQPYQYLPPHKVEIFGLKGMNALRPKEPEDCIYMAFSEENGMVNISVEMYNKDPKIPVDTIKLTYKLGGRVSDGGKTAENLLFAAIKAARKLLVKNKVLHPDSKKRKEVQVVSLYPDTDVRNKIAKKMKMSGMELGKLVRRYFPVVQTTSAETAAAAVVDPTVGNARNNARKRAHGEIGDLPEEPALAQYKRLRTMLAMSQAKPDQVIAPSERKMPGQWRTLAGSPLATTAIVPRVDVMAGQSAAASAGSRPAIGSALYSSTATAFRPTAISAEEKFQQDLFQIFTKRLNGRPRRGGSQYRVSVHGLQDLNMPGREGLQPWFHIVFLPARPGEHVEMTIERYEMGMTEPAKTQKFIYRRKKGEYAAEISSGDLLFRAFFFTRKDLFNRYPEREDAPNGATDLRHALAKLLVPSMSGSELGGKVSASWPLIEAPGE